MKLIKSLQEAIEETTSINNVDTQDIEKEAHGEAPIAYTDAVLSMQKRHKEIKKQLDDQTSDAEKELKISDADRVNVETPKNDNLKKMHLSESLFEDYDDDGWPEELAEYEVLRKIEDLIYELKNTVRGANSGAKTFDELADYIDILAGNLSDMAEDIREEYANGELEEDLNSKIEVFSLVKGKETFVRAFDNKQDALSFAKTTSKNNGDGQYVVKENGEEIASYYWGEKKTESLKEDTIKQGNKWVNKGKEGTHGSFKTKKEADAQRRAMFANKFEGLEESYLDNIQNPDYWQHQVDYQIEKFGRVGGGLIQDLDEVGFYLDADNKVKSKSVIPNFKNSLEEDLEREDSTPNPPTLENMGAAGLINALIQDEWQAIQGYNDAIATLASEDISEDIIAVFKDIVDEENIHVGQLQKALETVSPNAESISKGEKEGEEQLQEPVTPEEASL